MSDQITSIRQPMIGDRVLVDRKGYPDQTRPGLITRVEDASHIVWLIAFSTSNFNNSYTNVPHKLFDDGTAEHTWEYLPDPPVARIYTVLQK